MSIGPLQILLIILLVVLLFGAGKLPRLMGDVAKGINAFKKGLKEDDSVSSPSAQDRVKQVSSDADIDVQAEVVEEKESDKKAS